MSDAVYLLSFLFLSGPPPVCGAPIIVPASEGSCGLSAQLAAGACREGSLAEYRLACARCANLASPYAVDACVRSARESLDDALKECDGQLDARRALCEALGDAPYQPVIDPAEFVGEIDNPYLPLKPGTTLVYEKETADGSTERIVLAVTDEKREILGVSCTTVFETESEDDEEEEESFDWFAQDVRGNVWHFGGKSFELSDGEVVGMSGVWEAGVEGAQPGIAMLGAPAPGITYRRHLLLAEAEDAARVLSLDATAEVPHGAYAGCLLTEDFTPREPDFLEHKLYAPGVGLVLEVDLETGERVELIEVHQPE